MKWVKRHIFTPLLMAEITEIRPVFPVLIPVNVSKPKKIRGPKGPFLPSCLKDNVKRRVEKRQTSRERRLHIRLNSSGVRILCVPEWRFFLWVCAPPFIPTADEGVV